VCVRVAASVGDPDPQVPIFLGLPNPDLVVRGMDPAPDLVPSPFLIKVVSGQHKIKFKTKDNVLADKL
jgi:hypothetical protein